VYEVSLQGSMNVHWVLSGKQIALRMVEHSSVFVSPARRLIENAS